MSANDDLQDKELAALYRAASQEQPSAAVDARLLAAARAAGSAARTTTLPPRQRRWQVPFALAATVVLATSLVLLMPDRDADELPVPGNPQSDRQVPESAPASTPQPNPQAPSPKRDPGLVRPEPSAPERQRPAENVTREARTAASPSARDAAQSAGAPQDTANPAPAAAAGGVAEESAGSPVRQSAAVPSAPAAPSRPAAAVRSERSERAERTPEQWLVEIRKLRQEGRLAEAEASLAELKKRFPQFVLPDDLKAP